tara:strand:- start:5723 stop:7123 length:1401 start_codon:yes stop_codon:yes gene_type:complete
MFASMIFLLLFSMHVYAEDANDISIMHQIADPIDDITFFGVNSDDPRMISFVALQNDKNRFTSARLFYALPNPAANQSDMVGDKNASIQTAKSIQWLDVSLKDGTAFVADLDTNKGTVSSFYYPVGSMIEYYWEFIDSNNNLVKSETYNFVFLDGQYKWNQYNEANGINLYYYGPMNSIISAAAIAAEDAKLDAMYLLDIEINFPIRIIFYKNPNDALLAVPPSSSTFRSEVITAGVKYRTDVIHRYAGDFTIIRHEIIHIMTKIAGEGLFQKLPFWVDEGLAVYLMDDPSYDVIISDMIKRNAVFRLSSIQGKPGTSEKVNAFYAQSYSVTKYLIEEYGEEKYKNFFQRLKADTGLEEALLKTYDFDQDSLYLAWRDFHNMPIVTLEKLDRSSNAITTPVIKPLATPQSLQAGDIAPSASQSFNDQGDDQDRSSFYENPKSIVALFFGITFMLIMLKVIKKLWQE